MGNIDIFKWLTNFNEALFMCTIILLTVFFTGLGLGYYRGRIAGLYEAQRNYEGRQQC